MQSLCPAARAPAIAPTARAARPAAISPKAPPARHLAARRRRPLAAANYSSTPAASQTPTVSFRLGSAADAATLSLPLPPGAAKRLDGELRALLATMRAKQEAAEAGERPRRWPCMDFAFPSAEDDGDDAGALAFQLYCNPNAHGSAFDAKVLVRVECGGAAAAVVRMTGEARLTDVQGTLEAYWEELQAKGQ